MMEYFKEVFFRTCLFALDCKCFNACLYTQRGFHAIYIKHEISHLS